MDHTKHTAVWWINATKTAHDFCSFKADIKESFKEIKLHFHIINAKGGAVLSSAAKYYHSMW